MLKYNMLEKDSYQSMTTSRISSREKGCVAKWPTKLISMFKCSSHTASGAGISLSPHVAC
jgi:hypothetical protein